MLLHITKKHPGCLCSREIRKQVQYEDERMYAL
nr:MAG TPA: hypothetical protein [Caudoviricetes sp.]